MSQDLIEKHLANRRKAVPEIVPEKAALLVVDMQEYQVRKDWPVYKSLDATVPGILDYFMDRVTEVVEPNIRRLAALFRERKMKVIYTMFSSFNRDGSDLTRQLQRLNRGVSKALGDVAFPPVDHPGSKIIDFLKPEDDDLIIVKNTSGVFTATSLEIFLHNMGIEQLIVTGVVTNMCVEGAARTGAELGFDVILVDDACAAWSPEIHKASLRSLELLFCHVLNTGQVIERIKAKP
jgi:nicotinamidase-related amidase